MATIPVSMKVMVGDPDGPNIIKPNSDGSINVNGGGAGSAVTVAGAAASGAANTANPVKVGVAYNTALPTVTNGQVVDAQSDSHGNQHALMTLSPQAGGDGSSAGSGGIAVSSADGVSAAKLKVWPELFNGASMDRARSGGVTGMAGVNIQATPSGGASFTNIAAGQATTVVKGTPGTLYAITFNSIATASNVTTVYDNASGAGTVIAIPQATLATGLQTLQFGPAGLAFANGLTIITTTANGANMTVVWK